MLRRSRLVLAAAAATLALGIVAGTASANRLEVGTAAEGGLKSTWTRFEAAVAFGGARIVVQCPATLEGSFHSRTFSKVSGSLIGYVTRAALQEAECRAHSGEGSEVNARLKLLAGTLPWHLRYQSFSGTLPRITAVTVQIVGMAIEFELLGVECLYTSSTAAPLRYDLTLEGGTVLGLSPDESAIPKTSGGGFCSATLSTIGQAGTVTQQDGRTRVTIRLVS